LLKHGVFGVSIQSKTKKRTAQITTAPIGKLLVKLTGPMVLGIVSIMMLGVVDTYFISRLGTSELAAISFALPVSQLVVSTALGLGMAMGALVSRLIGAGDLQRAARFITDAQILAALVAAGIAMAGILTIRPLFILLGASADLLIHINDYMLIWYAGAPFFVLTLVGNNALRAIGDTKSSAYISAFLAILNGILDPLLIFGIGPFPRMGMEGAALATVIACASAWICSLCVLAVKEQLIDFSLPRMSHLLPNWRELLGIGVPSVAANLMTPIAATFLVAMIAPFGPEAVAGLGVGSRIEALSLIMVFALSSVLPMFIGQNIGAGQGYRAWQALGFCLRFCLWFQGGVYLILIVSAPWIATAFSDNPLVVSVVRQFLYILPLSYGTHGVVILTMVSLNVLKRPRTALFVTIIRLLVLYLPLAWLGSRFFGVTGMFAGAAIGNIIAAIFAYRIIRRVFLQQGLIPNQERE